MESPFRPDMLKGKAALVTGGGSGICFEIAAQLARHGAQIAIKRQSVKCVDHGPSSPRDGDGSPPPESACLRSVRFVSACPSPASTSPWRLLPAPNPRPCAVPPNSSPRQKWVPRLLPRRFDDLSRPPCSKNVDR